MPPLYEKKSVKLILVKIDKQLVVESITPEVIFITLSG